MRKKTRIMCGQNDSVNINVRQLPERDELVKLCKKFVRQYAIYAAGGSGASSVPLMTPW